MISAACVCYKKEFKNRINQYWEKVLQGLYNFEQKELFKATISCISDIARNHQDYVVDKIMNLFSKLLQIMQ